MIGDRPLVIAHVSDLHLGADDLDAVDGLPADVAAVGPDLTVVTGDLTMRARTAQFRRARRLLDRLPRPLLVVTGNHDLPLISTSRLVAPYERYQRWIDADLDPVTRLPGLTALGLNSMPRWRWKSGGVTAAQAAAVTRALGQSPPGAVRLLALHHPPFAGGLERLTGRRRLVRALATARVDLLLAGHTHVPDSRRVWLEPAAATVLRSDPAPATGVAPSLVEVVAGTATSLRTRGVGRSWTVLRIEAGAIVVQERHQGRSGWYDGPAARYPRPPR
jgi:3',5'-cyclic AMP phosphodiesterase CpdA